ncbi:hexadecenal dehydrogenase, partial [Ascoidea rubescens DSM 1968]
TSSSIELLPYTSIDEIPTIVQESHQFYHSRRLDDIEYRLDQLRQIYFAIEDNIELFKQALIKDFNRPAFETNLLEYTTLLNDLNYIINNLKKWDKPEYISKSPFFLFSSTKEVYIQSISLGVVLIISSFNYPLLLTLQPIIGAIAAGNCVIAKPSELTSHFTSILIKKLNERVDQNVLKFVNGSVEEVTTLLNQPFDKILYTGSKTVGRIVAEKASKNLTPVILELGGKSPAIITNNINLKKNLKTILKRILWGKFTNGGQTCIAVDYLLVPSEIYDIVTTGFIKLIIEDEFFPDLTSSDENFAHIINQKNFDRLMNLLNNSNGQLVTGGHYDSKTNFIEPTVLKNVKWDDITMSDEIFGPILPIVKYDNLVEACDKIIQYHDTPLSAYIFSDDKNEVEYFFKRIRSGSGIVNDVLVQPAVINAPFGGIGQSGYGNYHGKYSFDSFVHKRTMVKQPFWNEFLLKCRYPPFSTKNYNFLSLAI